MKIAFACPHCAKQLVADSAAAGRTGRCRHCGKPAVVPGGYTLRPVTPTKTAPVAGSDWDHAELGPAIAFPAAASRAFATASKAAANPTTRTAGRPAAQSVAAGRSRGASAAKTGPEPFAQGVGSVGPGFPELLASLLATATAALRPAAVAPQASGPAPAPLLVAYRSFFGLLGRLTAWISETSYTFSFILIILAIASGMIGRHALATMACGAIVALNLIGLAGDVASLVTLSFRKNPLQGALFLVPPFTFYYLWTDWYRYRDTLHRMRLPLGTLAMVAAAYVFVPWLRGGSAAEGRLVASVKQAVNTAEEKLAGRRGAIDEGLKQARSWLREVPLPDPSSLPALPALPGEHPAAPGGKRSDGKP